MVKIAVFASGGGTNFQAIIDAIDKGIILAKLQLLLIDRENAYAKERAIKSNIPWIYIGKKRFSDRETRVEFILGKLFSKSVYRK